MIALRHAQRPEGSYTTSLFEGGIRRIAQKVGEEGVETALAAVAQDDAALLGEAADLLYHPLALLRARGPWVGMRSKDAASSRVTRCRSSRMRARIIARRVPPVARSNDRLRFASGLEGTGLFESMRRHRGRARRYRYDAATACYANWRTGKCGALAGSVARHAASLASINGPSQNCGSEGVSWSRCSHCAMVCCAIHDRRRGNPLCGSARRRGRPC